MLGRLFSRLVLLVLLAVFLLTLYSWFSGATSAWYASASSPGHDVRLCSGCAPSLSASFLDRVLVSAHSPAAGKSIALFAFSQQYGIDDAYALAFFQQESHYGTLGEARASRSLGNLRCLPGVLCRDGYAWFSTWEAGFRAWYVLLSGPLYIGSGLFTVEQIIPRYAPSSDRNNEAAYIASVNASVVSWRSGSVEVQ